MKMIIKAIHPSQDQMNSEFNLLNPSWNSGILESKRNSKISSSNVFFIPFPNSDQIEFTDYEFGFKVEIFGKRKNIVKSLLRKAIYSGINAIEYYVFLYCLESLYHQSAFKTQQWILIIGLLSEIGSNFRNSSNPRHRSKKLGPLLKSIANIRYSDKNYSTFHSLVCTELSLPPQFDDSLISYTEKSYRKPDSKPVNLIGVGYRDKGYKKPDDEWLPNVPLYKPVPDSFNWNEFLQTFRKCMEDKQF